MAFISRVRHTLPTPLATRLKSVFDFNHFIYFIHMNQSRVTLCAMFLQDTDTDGESEDEEGFYLEYVLQSSQQVVPGGQPTSGPHLLEIIAPMLASPLPDGFCHRDRCRVQPLLCAALVLTQS